MRSLVSPRADEVDRDTGRAMSRQALAVTLATLLILVTAAGALAPAPARADGDPASDVLVSQSLFLPYDAGVSRSRQARLQALLGAAGRAGLPIRVAMIPSEYDLGSVGVLWRNPRTYARFLGVELSLTYTGRLLVAMPDGFGIDWPGHSTAAAYKALNGVPIGTGGAGLVGATEDAIRRLAAAEHIPIPSSASSSHTPAAHLSAGSSRPSSGRSPTSDSLALSAIVLLALALLAAVGGVLVVRRARTLAPARTANPAPADPAPVVRTPVVPASAVPATADPAPVGPQATGSLTRLRLSVVALAALCIGLGVAVVFVTDARHTDGQDIVLSTGASASPGASTGTAGSSGGEGPVAWPAGQRPAPDFQLTDQNGRAVSPANYRGRPVIVTFIDPLCRKLCPLAGKVLSQAVQQLPATRRPAIIAVSVDIYADTHSDLEEDYRRWSLVPQWQWAVGSPSRLASVWKRYYAEVQVETKHIAGTTVHYINHSEVAYLLDGRGYERRLFTWPYTARQVDAAVRTVS
jgi:protein SCO1